MVMARSVKSLVFISMILLLVLDASVHAGDKHGMGGGHKRGGGGGESGSGGAAGGGGMGGEGGSGGGDGGSGGGRMGREGGGDMGGEGGSGGGRTGGGGGSEGGEQDPTPTNPQPNKPKPRLCHARSHLFIGKCRRSGTCARVCTKEDFLDGHCRRSTCICTKLC